MRTTSMMTVVLLAAVGAGCSEQEPPMAASADERLGELASGPSFANQPPPPIGVEDLTARHQFTDDIAVQVRVKPDGRPTKVINMPDASNIAVIRFTVQPGVRFPWHSHPGLVMVTITQGELVFVYANDCVRRRYAAGTAFVDPGFGSIHYAFNPTGGETVLVATFLGVPATGPLTLPVNAAESVALDAKCNAAATMAHTH